MNEANQLAEKIAMAYEHDDLVCRAVLKENLIKAFTPLFKKLEIAQKDTKRLDHLDKGGIWDATCDVKSWNFKVVGEPGKKSTLRMDIRYAIDKKINYLIPCTPPI